MAFDCEWCLALTVEAGWWRDTAARDYWVAEGTEHAVHWVYRERLLVPDK